MESGVPQASSAEVLAQHRAYLRPMLWAFLSGSLLTGVISALCTQWFLQERRNVKRFESAVVLVGTGLTVAALGVEWHRGYQYFIQHGGDTTYTIAFHAEDYAWTIICTLCNITGQSWFVERAWRTSQSWLFLGTAVLFMLAELGAGLGVALMGFLHREDPSRWLTIGQLSIAVALLGAALDLLTAVVLIVRVKKMMRTLDRARSRPFEALVRLACATGSVTAIVGIIGAVLYTTVWTCSNAWLPFIEALPRISFLSCLITINSREKWRTALGLTPEPSSHHRSRQPRAPANLIADIVGAKLDTSAFERCAQASYGPHRSNPAMEEEKIASCHDLEKAVADYDEGEQAPQKQLGYESPFDKPMQAPTRLRPPHRLPRSLSLTSLSSLRSSGMLARHHPSPLIVQHVMVQIDRQIVVE